MFNPNSVVVFNIVIYFLINVADAQVDRLFRHPQDMFRLVRGKCTILSGGLEESYLTKGCDNHKVNPNESFASGNYMNAHVLLNLLTELRSRSKASRIF